MAAVIGALRAVMSLDSAAFQKGLTSAQKQLSAFQKKTDRIGSNMKDMGSKMSMGITAPIAALGAASRASISSMQQLQNQAAIAGESAEDFKLLSIAAGEFGIEQDKLADILKDVNDKLGDYAQTGAGPLADFFENIAPKVGITRKAFEGLSSSEALQLYVSSLEKANVSQAEMTFYMEAIASDATALTPLFRENGKALDEVTAAARKMGFSLDNDLLAKAKDIDREFRIVQEVMGVQMKQALVSLAPAFAELAKVMIPLVQDAARFINDMAAGFAALDPGTQKFIAGATALAATLGPVIAGMGFLVSGLGAVSGAFASLAAVMAANPIGLTLVAIAGAATLIIKNWEPISGFFSNLWSAITAAAEDAWSSIRTAFLTGGTRVLDALVAVWDGIKAEVASWPGQFVKLGGDIMQGLIDGLKQKWTDLKDSVSSIGTGMVNSIKETLGIHSPSRVFRQIGDFAMQGLQQGIERGAPMVESAVNSSMDYLSTLESGAKTIFKDVLTGAQGFSESLGGVLDGISNRLMDSAIDGLFGAIMPFAQGGVFSGGRVTAFASGGVVNSPTFFPMRGGSGLMGEAGPEAILPLTRIGGDLGVKTTGGPTDVRVYVDQDGNWQAAVERISGQAVQRAAPSIKADAMAATQRQMRTQPKSNWGIR